MTREDWLESAMAAMRDWHPTLSQAPPARVSVGFPKGGGRARIGECWLKEVAADGRCQIFVSPVLHEAPAVLACLLHEMIHAALPSEAKHGKPFSTVARSLGLEKPWTATAPGPELAERLNALSAALPPYPHAALVPAQKKKPGSRLRLWECGCEPPVKVRIASDEFAATCDHCSEAFKKQETGE